MGLDVPLLGYYYFAAYMWHVVRRMADGSNWEKQLMAEVVWSADLPALLGEGYVSGTAICDSTDCTCVGKTGGGGTSEGVFIPGTADMDPCSDTVHGRQYVLPSMEGRNGCKMLGDLYPNQQFISFEDAQAEFGWGLVTFFIILAWLRLLGRPEL
ncbi:hypothetical protein NDU88_004014 [Pleurodeles waltl]|uniref:Uncharacterized protein n=1 Tax=Pleurodeles waltl TaxID=8319 RepID=A0AAV7SHR7_PLEWA|nr:hypothetical protein NDU88_004014 [Pleurodeles waltl]